MTEIIANTDDAIKAATDDLIWALDSKTATKAKIEELAQQCSKLVYNPLETTLKLKPVIELLSKLKDVLNEEALKAAKAMPESKRRLENLTYDVITKKTYKFNDEFIKEMELAIKDRKAELIEKEGWTELKETPYIRINIPKE